VIYHNTLPLPELHNLHLWCYGVLLQSPTKVYNRPDWATTEEQTNNSVFCCERHFDNNTFWQYTPLGKLSFNPYSDEYLHQKVFVQKLLLLDYYCCSYKATITLITFHYHCSAEPSIKNLAW